MEIENFSARRPLSSQATVIETPLIIRFRSGDPIAFGKIYEHFWDRVFRQVKQLVEDAQAAEDLAQEVFLKVFRFRDSYDAARPFTGWLRSVTRNTALDWLRKNWIDRQTEELGEELACADPGAEVLLLEEGRRNQLVASLQRLSRLQRRVVLLRTMKQLSYNEISERLGLSVSSVKCAMYRAKHLLQAQPIAAVRE